MKNSIKDIVKTYHSIVLQGRDELFHSKSLASVFKIAIEVLNLCTHTHDVQYLKSNLKDGHSHEKLKDALKENLNDIEKEEFLSAGSPEILTRTPMHIINDVVESRIKFVRKPELFNLFAENIINIILPIYKYLNLKMDLF